MSGESGERLFDLETKCTKAMDITAWELATQTSLLFNFTYFLNK